MAGDELRDYESLRDFLVKKAARWVSNSFTNTGVSYDDAFQEIWVWLLEPNAGGVTGEERVRGWLHEEPRRTTRAKFAMVDAAGRSGLGRDEAAWLSHVMLTADDGELEFILSTESNPLTDRGRRRVTPERHVEVDIEENPSAEVSWLAGARVRGAVADLSDGLRAVVQLHYFDGWRCDRVAKHLGISTDAVYKRLERARAELAGALEGAARYAGFEAAA